MPTMKAKRTLAPGEVFTPFQGQQYEFLPFPALLEFVLVADGDDVFGEIHTGSDLLLQDAELEVLAAAERISIHDDTTVSDIVGGGERIGCRITNRAAAAREVTAICKITSG